MEVWKNLSETALFISVSPVIENGTTTARRVAKMAIIYPEVGDVLHLVSQSADGTTKPVGQYVFAGKLDTHAFRTFTNVVLKPYHI